MANQKKETTKKNGKVFHVVKHGQLRKTDTFKASTVHSIIACIPVAGNVAQRNMRITLPHKVDTYREEFVTMIANSYATRYRLNAFLDHNTVRMPVYSELRVLNNFYMEFTANCDALKLYNIKTTENGETVKCLYTAEMRPCQDEFVNKNALVELYDAFVTEYMSELANEKILNQLHSSIANAMFIINHDVEPSIDDEYLCGAVDSLECALNGILSCVKARAQANYSANQKTLF